MSYEQTAAQLTEASDPVGFFETAKHFLGKVWAGNDVAADYGTGYYVRSQDYATGVPGMLDLDMDQLYEEFSAVDRAVQDQTV